MTATVEDLTVIARDETSKKTLRSAGVKSVKNCSPQSLRKAKNVFVLATATDLNCFTDLVRQANQLHKLRALFVRNDVNLPFLAHMFARAELRTLRNLIVHSGTDLPQRVIFAWSVGAQDKLIADANVIDDHLFVLSCANEPFEIPFGAIRDLAKIPASERGDFEIAEDGSYLHWPKFDIHLDLDEIRCAADPKLRAAAAAQSIEYDVNFGKAVAGLRKEIGLRQSDIRGLSERQVGRIEKGSRPRLDSLEKLAEAHGMKINDYLEAIARKIHEVSEETR